jgi:preprotein translocase subunit SecY
LATPSASINSISGLGRHTELRQRLFFLLIALIVFRLGSFVPLPGVDPKALADALQQQKGGLFDLFNMFSGGAFARLSVFALGVTPYISASIVVQLLATAYPPWQALRKEGESGRRKLTEITRMGTVALALFQSVGVATYALNQTGASGPIVHLAAPLFYFITMVGLTGGTLFLMWLGEQITERGLGNGISMLIFAGIVAGLPSALLKTFELSSKGSIGPLAIIALFVIALAVIAAVVFMERGQRRITVNYAKRAGGRQAYMNQSSHLPLKINMSGVIPAVFASSIIMFPATLAGMFGQNENFSWLQRVQQWLSPGEPLYLILEAVLIIGFAFFYTAMMFNSAETAENLKKSGALIPGIRPGKATADYIDGVTTRLTLIGAIYLVVICLVPSFLQGYFKVPFYFGGTSLLIVVVVVMDFMAQVQAHLMSHQYDSVLRKANFKGMARTDQK